MTWSEFFLTLLALGSFALVSLLVVFCFAIHVLLGCAALVATIVAHVLVRRAAKKKQSEINPGKTLQEILNATSSYTSSSDVKFYADVKNSVDSIFSMLVKLAQMPTFQAALAEKNASVNFAPSAFDESLRILKNALLRDIIRCYTGTNNTIGLNGKSGWGVLYYTYLLRCMSVVQIKSPADVPYAEKERVQALLKTTADEMNGIGKPLYIFEIADMLQRFDNDYFKKFMIEMYRFASLTCKSDDLVTDSEANWLSEIMRVSDKSTVVSAEEDDEQEDAEPVAPAPTPKPAPKKKSAPRGGKSELKSLIGLENVKTEVETLSNFIKIQQTREEKGLKSSPISYHCVFTGNPGTGKTTVARILAKIYKRLGVVSKGHLVETDRSGLVAEYVGQTAVKTNKIIDSALDGVLFIDEAYSLIAGSGQDFGKEAIATLLKRMEDDRGRLVVILAGYSKEMKDFIDSNPGLQSRFNRYIEFPDYSAEELYEIYCRQLKQFEYTITDDAAEKLKAYFVDQVAHKDQNFGNGRFVRNVFERTLQQQANRLSRERALTEEQLSQITIEDLPL